MLKEANFIDIHYHANPDLYQRRYNALATGEQYAALKGCVVLKSHLGSTAEVAYLARQKGLPVYGSLVLNKIGGGINYHRALSALANHQTDEAHLIVHLPTITGRQHQSKLQRKLISEISADALLEPEIISNEMSELKSSVIDILKLSLDYPIVISSGHASKKEVFLLIEAADKLGVKKLLLNQPANPLTGFNYEELNQLTGYEFLWFEQTALTVLLGYQSIEDFGKVLTQLPRVIYSSDLGQLTQIDLPDWITQSNTWFKSLHVTKERQYELCKHNPMKLLT